MEIKHMYLSSTILGTLKMVNYSQEFKSQVLTLHSKNNSKRSLVVFLSLN